VESAALRAVLEQIDPGGADGRQRARAGRSGTRKELVAQAIHERSRRHAKPLVRGQLRGDPARAFRERVVRPRAGLVHRPGARSRRSFDLADGGTLLLDEVGEVPLELQGKLLRVLQEGTFERVGDERTRRVDARIVAVTNRYLRREIDSPLS
jgi:transcriptional regulator with GAF, ATPase, and Fis domain